MNVDLFGDYQRLLRVDVLGRQVEMPESNTLLRGFQFAAPQTISYGRFCWNGTCNNCTVTVRDGACESKGPACVMDAHEGMHVTSVSGKSEGCYNFGSAQPRDRFHLQSNRRSSRNSGSQS